MNMSSKYSDIDDEQLIVMVHDGDEPAIVEYMMNKYKELVRKKANSMYILGREKHLFHFVFFYFLTTCKIFH